MLEPRERILRITCQRQSRISVVMVIMVPGQGCETAVAVDHGREGATQGGTAVGMVPFVHRL